MGHYKIFEDLINFKLFDVEIIIFSIIIFNTNYITI
jgi:hypothetical protein